VWWLAPRLESIRRLTGQESTCAGRKGEFGYLVVWFWGVAVRHEPLNYQITR
jgi:hypothetical protein